MDMTLSIRTRAVKQSIKRRMNLFDSGAIYAYDLEERMQSCNNSRMSFCEKNGAVLLLMAFLLAPVWLFAADTGIPEKTRITLQLNETLSTRSNAEGDAFSAVVTMPVYSGGRIIIPKGSVVSGSISRIMRPGRIKGKAIMDLIFQSMKIPGRKPVNIAATLIRVDMEGNDRVRLEGSAEGAAGGAANKIVIPSLAGAGIDSLAGGGKGAASGFASIFASRGKDIEIHRGSTIDIRLDRPLIIPAEGDDSALK